MTDLESRLRRSFADDGWDLPAPADPVSWAQRRARRQRWRAGGAAALALSTAVALAALVLPPLGADGEPAPPAAPVERGCATASSVDCVDPSPDVVPVAALLSLEEVWDVDPLHQLWTNSRSTGPLSLCSGLNSPGSTVPGGLDGRLRSFGHGDLSITQQVLRYADPGAATESVKGLERTVEACTTTRADGPYFQTYAPRPPPTGLDGSWFTVTGGMPSTVVAAWSRGRDVMLLTAATEDLVRPLVAPALARVEAPPAYPLCDTAGCDSGEQHPAGLPAQVLDGQNDQMRWAVFLDAEDFRTPFTDRGYAYERRDAMCWQGASGVSSPAVAVLVPDEAGARVLADVLGDGASVRQVTLRCLA